MTALTVTRHFPDRQDLVAGAIVGAVVLVLGFGSGIGAVLTKHHSTSTTVSHQQVLKRSSVTAADSAAPPEPGASRVQASTDSAGDPATGPAAGPIAGPMDGVRPPSAGPARAAPVAGSSDASRATPAPASSCATKTVVNAMLDPLVVHLQKAHLEESPFQQVTQLLNIDQYTKTHTVLLESILMPLVTMLEASMNGINPLIVHLDKAHLEESPYQQVSQLVNIDQYTKTHTVLAEEMLAPALAAALGTGGC